MFKKLKQKIEETDGDSLKKVAESFAAALPGLQNRTSSQSSLADQSLGVKGASQESLASVSPETIALNPPPALKPILELHSSNDNPELGSLRKQIADYENVIRKQEMALHSRQIENEKLAESVERLNAQLTESSERTVHLDNRISDLLSENLRLVKAEDQLKDNIKHSNGIIESLSQELKQCSQGKSELADMNSGLERRLEDSKQNEEGLEVQVKTLGMEIEELKLTTQFENVKVDSENVDGVKLTDTYKLLKSENELLAAEMEEKNKTIKQLQQRLNDIKKELQKHVRSVPTLDLSETTASPSDSLHRRNNSNGGVQSPLSSQQPGEWEVNFQYLKNVIFKFLTSSEYEAKHLVRAVSTLLKLSRDEEQYLAEMLDWRSSWFRSRPYLRRPNFPSS